MLSYSSSSVSFLLDEPTARLDPFSRHQVWTFLKEHKTNCTILLSTQIVDEADIMGGDSWFLSSNSYLRIEHER